MADRLTHDTGDDCVTMPMSLFNPDEIVLIVDDDPAVRSILTWRIGQLGCTVAEAGSAEEALDVAESVGWKIALLVTDVTMPGMSGYALGAHLANRCAGLRVLYVTGDVAEELSDATAPCCAWAMLEKPFDTHLFTSTISELMARVRVARH